MLLRTGIKQLEVNISKVVLQSQSQVSKALFENSLHSSFTPDVVYSCDKPMME